MTTQQNTYTTKEVTDRPLRILMFGYIYLKLFLKGYEQIINITR